MVGFLRSLFKTKPARVIEDPALGSLLLRDGDWCFQMSVNGQSVEASIPDTSGSPSVEARNVAEVSVATLPSLWKAAVEYTVDQIAPLNPKFKVEPSEFELEAVSFHAPGAFEGGEVTFWFRIVGDRNGSYFVPLHDGVPLLWHRDS